MHINIAARHAEITEQMRDYAEKKAELLGERFDLLTGVQVTLTFEKKRHVVEFIGFCHKHDPIVASATGEEIYGTIDLVWDKMMEQLRRHKERVKSHRT